MGFPAYYTQYGGQQPGRSGARHASIAPYGPFKCGDGEIMFMGIQNEREWEKFCQTVLNRPELANDERFDTNSRRVKNRDALDEEIEAVFGGLSGEEIIEHLEEAQIANARMRNVDDFLDHPQLEARDRWREVGSPVGPLRALIPPVTSDGWESRMKPIPEVGQHTDTILKELGFDPETINTLQQT